MDYDNGTFVFVGKTNMGTTMDGYKTAVAYSRDGLTVLKPSNNYETAYWGCAVKDNKISYGRRAYEVYDVVTGEYTSESYNTSMNVENCGKALNNFFYRAMTSNDGRVAHDIKTKTVYVLPSYNSTEENKLPALACHFVECGDKVYGIFADISGGSTVNNLVYVATDTLVGDYGDRVYTVPIGWEKVNIYKHDGVYNQHGVWLKGKYVFTTLTGIYAALDGKAFTSVYSLPETSIGRMCVPLTLNTKIPTDSLWKVGQYCINVPAGTTITLPPTTNVLAAWNPGAQSNGYATFLQSNVDSEKNYIFTDSVVPQLTDNSTSVEVAETGIPSAFFLPFVSAGNPISVNNTNGDTDLMLIFKVA
jgi:hypothetical protein